MKINKISIQNFKVFTKILIDFNGADALVFDGPNGFGKTTIYDAIELVFTGKIRRYDDLKQKLIDGRQTFDENPLYNENAKGLDIIITIDLTKNGKSYILERVAAFNEINGVLDFSIYKLFTKADFEAEERIMVIDEKAFLTELFGKYYDSNFQFLNYVEQEECLFLLKHSDKSRKTYIGHLFDLKEFEVKIERIEYLKRTVDLSCNVSQKEELGKLGGEITQLKESVSAEATPTEAIQLFTNRDFDWDKDNLDINTINYQEIAGSDGLLERLKKIVERKGIVKQYQINSAVDYLLENVQLLNRFLKFFNFISRKDEFRSIKTLNKSLQSLIIQISNLTSVNIEAPIQLDSFEFIPSEIKERFLLDKGELQRSQKELSGLDVVYSDISVSRQLLNEKLNVLKEAGNSNGECVLCGYDWDTIDKLLIQIEAHSSKIKDINSDKSNRFNESFSSFKTGIAQDLIKIIGDRLAELVYDASFVDELLIIEASQFNEIIRALDFLKVNYTEFLKSDEEFSLESNASFTRFTAEISALKAVFDEQNIESYFRDYLRLYFDNSTEKIEKLTLVNIEKKKNYLNYLWSLSRNELLQRKTEELANKTKKYDDAILISGQLYGLRNIYKASLAKYQKVIIRDIEVVFHIYSGRIMQSLQGGSGLFIFSEKDGIRFQSNPDKTYDAVFSMSSGQLSALIISFTLSLHKKYSQNKVILIDDPVQTMDELNLYGFIDLLRNEFSNNQIIMSTHEDMMSAFMRYKFKNYNFSEKRINLKNMLQIGE